MSNVTVYNPTDSLEIVGDGNVPGRSWASVEDTDQVRSLVSSGRLVIVDVSESNGDMNPEAAAAIDATQEANKAKSPKRTRNDQRESGSKDQEKE